MFSLCLIFLIAGYFPFYVSNALADEGSFSFAAIGDLHVGKEKSQSHNPEWTVRENIRQINLLSPDFVIIVGDLIETPKYVRSRMHGWKDLILKWENFDRTAATFEMPFYMVVGNHDVWDKESEEVHESRYGSLYYSFDFGNSHFVILDSEVVGFTGQIKGEQLIWLEKDLEKHAETEHIFVFLHKPLWGGEGDWDEEVHPVLARHGVDAVFSGHDHRYEMWGVRDGIRYFITGGGGKEPGLGDWEIVGSFNHFMLVTVRGDNVKYAVVKTKGGIESETFATRELKEKALSLERDLPKISLPQSEKVDEEVELTLYNPFELPIEREISWDLPEGSSWVVNPMRCRFHIDQGDSVKLGLKFSAEVSTLFPPPKLRSSLGYGGEEVFWITRQLPVEKGWYIKDWMVIGPFDLMAEDSDEIPAGFISPYPPEKEIKLDKKYSTMAGRVSWVKCSAGENGYVRYNFKPNDRVVGYALSYIYSPEDWEVLFGFGSDDGAKIWVNDDLVFKKHAVGRPLDPDQDAFRVRLRKGWNKILVKEENLRGGWGFFLRPVDVRGILRYGLGPEDK